MPTITHIDRSSCVKPCAKGFKHNIQFTSIAITLGRFQHLQLPDKEMAAILEELNSLSMLTQ